MRIPRFAIAVVLTSSSSMAYATDPLDNAENHIPFSKPSYASAVQTWKEIPVTKRMTFQVALTALGCLPGLVSKDYSEQLEKAVETCQSQNSLLSTGVVDDATLTIIIENAKPNMRKWGFRNIGVGVDHLETVWVPFGLDGILTYNGLGMEYTLYDEEVVEKVVTFEKVTIQDAYTNIAKGLLSEAQQNHKMLKIIYKKVAGDFFVINAERTNEKGTTEKVYHRYQSRGSGVVGFSLLWNADFADGEALATLMSDSLATSHYKTNFIRPPSQTDLTDDLELKDKEPE